nr:hypothetical protein Iba_chr10fCG12040 [Ipomoea batatas]GMD49040.1 hypothetical protein Iba_chr10fCG12060 [Ipomoea batatas]
MGEGLGWFQCRWADEYPFESMDMRLADSWCCRMDNGLRAEMGIAYICGALYWEIEKKATCCRVLGMLVCLADDEVRSRRMMAEVKGKGFMEKNNNRVAEAESETAPP